MVLSFVTTTTPTKTTATAFRTTGFVPTTTTTPLQHTKIHHRTGTIGVVRGRTATTSPSSLHFICVTGDIMAQTMLVLVKRPHFVQQQHSRDGKRKTKKKETGMTGTQ